MDDTPEPVCTHRAEGGDGDPALPAEPTRHRRRYSWAELMRRVHRIDVLICQHCGGPRRVLAFLTDPAVIERILSHLALATEAPH